ARGGRDRVPGPRAAGRPPRRRAAPRHLPRSVSPRPWPGRARRAPGAPGRDPGPRAGAAPGIRDVLRLGGDLQSDAAGDGPPIARPQDHPRPRDGGPGGHHREPWLSPPARRGGKGARGRAGGAARGRGAGPRLPGGGSRVPMTAPEARSSVEEHKAHAPRAVRCVVCTISDSKTPDTDTSGQLLRELLTAAGHEIVGSRLVRDEPAEVHGVIHAACADPQVQAVVFTGGTGITARDRTYEAIDALLEKRLPGFGELFRMLSFQEIGPAAMLSRAQAG